ncbi:MAG: hypothetical protein ABIP11_07500 [Luteimonas sp.]
MRRTNLLTASLATALIGCGLLGSSVFAEGTGSHAQVVGTSLAAPQSRMQARQAIDDATAAALIGAISSQLAEPNVVVKLDHVEASQAGMIQRELQGAGRLQIGADQTWIPFAFQALYDTEQSSVGNPRLTLGDASSGQGSVANAAMTKKLTALVAQRLHQEFAQQPVRVALDSVRTVAAGKNFLQVQARGTASFGKEGATDADVHGLYDLRKNQWVQLDYELGASLDSATPGQSVASL